MRYAIKVGFDIIVWGGFAVFLSAMYLSLPAQAKEITASWIFNSIARLGGLL